MLYTLGHTVQYQDGLQRYGADFRKLGCTPDYPGGSVWLTIDEALHVAKVNPTFSVFGLLTDESNIYERDGDLHLVESCQIVEIETNKQLNGAVAEMAYRTSLERKRGR